MIPLMASTTACEVIAPKAGIAKAAATIAEPRMFLEKCMISDTMTFEYNSVKLWKE